MTTSRNARAFVVALGLIIVGGVAAFWWGALQDHIEFGPGCAAEFSC